MVGCRALTALEVILLDSHLMLTVWSWFATFFLKATSFGTPYPTEKKINKKKQNKINYLLRRVFPFFPETRTICFSLVRFEKQPPMFNTEIERSLNW